MSQDTSRRRNEGTTRRRALVAAIGAILAAVWFFFRGENPDDPAGGSTEPDDLTDVTVDEPWPTFQYDVSNRAWVPDGDGPTAAIESRWEFATDDIASGCSVVDGTVFVGTDAGWILALDAATGTERWRFDADGAVRSVPAVHEGTVYVGTNEHTLYAIDADSGEKRWQTTLPHRPQSPTVEEGTVYVATYATRTLHAIATADGSERWKAELPEDLDSVEATPAIGEFVYLADPANGIVAFDPADGTVAWETPFEQRMKASPALADGQLYVAGGHESAEGVVAALDASTGERLWTTTTGSGIQHCPAVTDEAVYVSEHLGGQVYRLDWETGDLDWEVVREDRGRVGGAAVVAGTLYVTGSASRNTDSVWAFDPGSGDLRWSFQTGGSVLGPPAVTSGLVFVGSSLPDGGRVMALQEPR